MLDYEQVKDWMCRHFLQLNEDKTEIIVFGAKTERLKVTQHPHSLSLKTSTKARNLGVIMHSDLHLDSYMKSVTKSADYHLKNVDLQGSCPPQTYKNLYMYNLCKKFELITVHQFLNHYIGFLYVRKLILKSCC